MTEHIYQNHQNVPMQALRQIRRRGQLVGALRFAVPAVGIIFVLAILSPAATRFILPPISYDSIHIDNSGMTIDVPKSRGTMANGGHYELTAQTASTKFSKPDMLYLDEVKGLFHFADGTLFHATAKTGEYLTSGEVLKLPGQISLFSPDQGEGAIATGTADIKAQQFSGTGGVKFVLVGGTELDADTIFYDAGRGVWVFTGATLVMEADMDADQER